MSSYTQFYITSHIPRAALATNQVILTPPVDLNLVDVRLRYRVASVSGFVYLVKTRHGQSVAEANAISGLISLCGTHPLTSQPIYGPPDTVLPLLSEPLYSVLNRNQNDDPVTGALGYRIKKDDSLGINFQGDLTGLADLTITCVFEKIFTSTGG